MNHTPFPWTCERDLMGHLALWDQHGNNLLHSDSDLDMEEREANGELPAKAPELLERQTTALRRLRSAVEFITDQGPEAQLEHLRRLHLDLDGVMREADACLELTTPPADAPKDPVAVAASHDLHSPELEALIPAIISAYESARRQAEKEHHRSGVPIAVTYDRISNGEDETPFSFCPPASVPLLQRFGTILVTIGA